MSEKPTTTFTNPAQLPQYLQRKGKFCLWKYEQNKGRWTKVPYQPRATQYGAASTNTAHFTDLREAMNARAGFDGIGLGIFGEVAAIDIDHCINDAGELSKLAQTVIETMDTYTEYSPSGKGIRIIFRAPGFSFDKSRYYINQQDAKDPGEVWETQQGLEVYIAGATNKYVTVTGNTIRAKDAEERSAQVQAILDRYMRRQDKAAPSPAPASLPVDVSDRELIDIASRGKNGARFVALYSRGEIEGYPSQSEADQALMNSLAFYTGKDEARMIELFKSSALYRPKEKPESYYKRTAQTAIRDCKEVYTRQMQAKTEAATKIAEAPKEETPKTTADAVAAFMERARSHDYEPIPTGYSSIDAAIGGGFIRQTIVSLGAAPGAGKTIFAQQIFENIARADRANVLYFNLEMSAEQMIARSISRETELTPLEVLQGYKWTEQREYAVTIAAQKYRDQIAPRIKYNACNSADYRAILEAMETEAKDLKEKGDNLPLLVVIDYLQLLQGAENDPAETIKAALKGFKDFAINHGAVVFIIMAQSRSTNETGKATQGAGRDTSALEYTADTQLSLTYQAMEMTTKNENSGKETPKYGSLSEMFSAIGKLREMGENAQADQLIKWRKLTVTKNRFCVEFASCKLCFEGAHSRFMELDTKHTGNTYADSYHNSNLPFDAPTKKPKVRM